MNTRAAALTGAVLWGGSVLLLAMANLMRPAYGREFLRVISSVYPGYSGRRTVTQVAVAGLYAAADGAIGGALTAAVYNKAAAGLEKRRLLRAA